MADTVYITELVGSLAATFNSLKEVAGIDKQQNKLSPVLEAQIQRLEEQIQELVSKIVLPPHPSAEILEWARGRFSESEIADGIREIRETGGVQLADFLPQLERIVGHE